MRGRKPRPGSNPDAPSAPDALPRCPAHLGDIARKEWRRLARPLHRMGVLSTVDRAAFAAYCQAYARWVEAEQQLRRTPMLLKTASGYVQQSPWLSIANKQLELMGRYMTELGLTPASRARVAVPSGDAGQEPITFRLVYMSKDGIARDGDGNVVEHGKDGAIDLSGDL